jgi:ferritin
MENGLTKIQTLTEIQKLIDLLFQGNSLHDNIVYSMATYLNLPNFYLFMHYSISHVFPEFSDMITDFGIERNDVFHRNALITNDREYNNIIECLQDSYNCFIGIQNQVEKCIDSAIETKDKSYEDFIRDFNFNKVSLYIKQIKTLLNAAEQYASSGILPLFNENFKSYITLPEDLVKYN